MKKNLTRTGLPIVCILATSLSASQVFADWSGDKLYKGYNQRFGDFPPADIDEQLSAGAAEADKVPEESAPAADPAATVTNSNQAVTNPAQSYTTQPLQQPAYGNYYQNGYYPQPGMQGYNRRSNFSGPRNNRGSSFSGPWNSRGSSFSGPWDNRGSGFSGPWDNNGSSFSGPWNNNRSGFSPWGNGGGWSW